MRPRSGRGLAALATAIGLLAGCGSPPDPALTVGATADPDSVLLAELYAGALRGSGAAVQVRTVTDPIGELGSGTLTLVPGFTGRLLETFAPGTVARADRQVYAALVGALPEGIAAGDYATGAEDKPLVAVTAATATAWHADGLRALPGHCAGLTAGAVPGAELPVMVGRCRLPAPRRFADDTALFDALNAGTISVAWTSTADPGRPGAGTVALADGTPALVRAENVVPLYRRNELAEPQLLAVNEVAGVLDTAALVQLRRRMLAGADPRAVAADWLAEHPLGR